MILAPGNHQDKIRFGLQKALIRPIEADETKPLMNLLDQAKDIYEANPKEAEQLLQSSRAESNTTTTQELATWIIIASAILNLDEFYHGLSTSIPIPRSSRARH